MAGEYGADYFFVSSSGKNGTARTDTFVAAKYLKDKDGAYVIDPVTMAPYIVPVDYDPAVVITKFTNFLASIFGSSIFAKVLLNPRPVIYAYLAEQFYPGGASDIQRTYNGLSNAPFVAAFTNAASFTLGLASYAENLFMVEPEISGGSVNRLNSLISGNLINTSGPFGNAINPSQNNDTSIQTGYAAGEAHIFATTATPPPSITPGFTLAPDGTTMIFPDGSASTRAINSNGTSTVSTASPNGNTSVINYNKARNITNASIRTVNGDGTYTLSNTDVNGTADSTTYRLSDDSIVNKTVITSDWTNSYTSYSANRNISSATVTHIDGSGSITNYSDTGNKLHEKITNSDGSTTTKDYYINGNLQAATTYNADGSGSIESYDPYGAGSKKIINTDGSFTNTICFAGGVVSSVNGVNADGSNTYTVYNTDGSVYSETSNNADGSGSNSRKAFGYPDTMVSNTDGSATFYYGSGVWSINGDGSGNRKSNDPVTGASSTMTVNADGTWTEEATDGSGGTTTGFGNAYGSYSSVTHLADGTYYVWIGNGDGSITFYGNNGSNFGPVIIPGTPLSNPQTSTDRNGTVITASHYADGYFSVLTITNLDGSVERTSYYPFGQNYGWDVTGFPSSRVITYHDGSSESTKYYANGIVSEDLYTNADGSRYTSHRYPNGNLSSEENTSATGSDIKHYYADGNLFSETITRVDGSSSSRSYYVDGLITSSETITNVDGTGSHTTHYADGFVSYKSITNADGSCSAISYYGNGLPKAATYSNTDGTSGSINYYINGNVSSNETHFSNGSVAKSSFAFDGTQQSDSWSNFDGSSGFDTFKADGSSSGKVYAVDHSYYSYTNDEIGGITTNNYAANNVKLSDSWIADNGTVGSDVFYTDGSYTSTIYAANGSIATQSVTFAQGVMPGDLQLSWGQTIGSISGLATDPQLNYTTLNLSWEAGSQSILVMIPHIGEPLGSGMSGFTFANGTTLSLAQMSALAPAAPTFDPQIFQYQHGMGVQVLGAGYSSINFGPGITSSMVTLGLGSLMLRVGNNGDVIHIENFDPSNALAANSIQNFNFADGTSLSYDQLLARGFDIYGTTGNETLSGTNLDNRIYAGTGNDTLIGTGTSDTLVTGAGLDTLIGGTGIETFVINNSDDVVIANPNAASNSIISSVSYVLPNNVQSLTLTGSDDLIATTNGQYGIITGNAGNDTLIGGATIIAGSGANQIFAGTGSTIIQVDPNTVSTDLIGGAGDSSQVLDKYYQSMGISDWYQRYRNAAPGMYYMNSEAGTGYFNAQTLMNQFQGWGVTFQQVINNGWAIPLDPLPVLLVINNSSIFPSAYYSTSNVPVVNLSTNNYQALASLFAQGILPQHTVSFGQGVTASDLNLSWGTIVGSISGLSTDPQQTYTTLNISWGTNNQSIHIMIPHFNDPLGSGVSQFTFADGSTLNMAQMIAMAPAAPTFDPQIIQLNQGSGQQTIIESLNSSGDTIKFGAGISAGDTQFVLNGSDLLIAYGTQGDSALVQGFAANGATGNYSIGQFQFDDGSQGRYINDGQGNAFLNAYDTSGLLVGDFWQHSDGAYGNDTYNADGSSSKLNHNPDGSYYTYTQDVSGKTSTFVDYDSNGKMTGEAWNKADGSWANYAYLADGSSNNTIHNADGSFSNYVNNGQGYFNTSYYDASGNNVGDSWHGADGSHGTDTNNADGSYAGTYYYPDGSYFTSTQSASGVSYTEQDYASNGNLTGSYSFTSDGMGNYFEGYYDPNGTKTSDGWGKADGTYGDDVFNADSSSTGTSYNTDGSYSSYSNDGLGSIITTSFDANGNELGYSIALNNGQGAIRTTQYDATGTVLASSLVTNDGLKNITTTNFDGNGIKLSDTWTQADGTYGSDTYNADGSHSSYSIIAIGTSTDSYYNTAGQLTVDYWSNPNGSSGSDTYSADGSHRGYSINEAGTSTDSYYNPAGQLTVDYWSNPNGSSGSDTYSADGSHRDYSINAAGTSTDTYFNTAGQQTVDYWSNPNGSSGSDTYNADGSHRGYSINAAGTSTDTYYNTTGQLTSDYWVSASGMQGGDTYTYNADGSSLQQWTKSDGSSGTLLVNSGGVTVGDSVLYADGSQSVNANGNHLVLGCAVNDTINALDTGNEILIGGQGNDTLTTGSGSNLIAFDKGDGQDVLNAAAGQNNTVSLGGNFAYNDLALQHNGNDLVLDIGASNSITFKGWYAGNHNIVNLQVIAAAMSDFNPGSTDVLRNSNVENFDFQMIVNAFDQAQIVNPGLSAWGVTNSLLDAHLASNDSAALGGDLAYTYGTHGNLTGLGVVAAQGTLSNTQFASAPQTLNPWPSLNTGTVQIQ